MKHFRLVLAAMLTLPLAVSAQAVSAQNTVSAQKTGSTQSAPDPARVLQATGERLLADLKRMPRYTCVQTITRTYYEGKHQSEHPSCSSLITEHDRRKKKLPVLGWDRLRLEVALVEGIAFIRGLERPGLLTIRLTSWRAPGRWVVETLAFF